MAVDWTFGGRSDRCKRREVKWEQFRADWLVGTQKWIEIIKIVILWNHEKGDKRQPRWMRVKLGNVLLLLLLENRIPEHKSSDDETGIVGEFGLDYEQQQHRTMLHIFQNEKCGVEHESGIFRIVSVLLNNLMATGRRREEIGCHTTAQYGLAAVRWR